MLRTGGRADVRAGRSVSGLSLHMQPPSLFTDQTKPPSSPPALTPARTPPPRKPSMPPAKTKESPVCAVHAATCLGLRLGGLQSNDLSDKL